MASHVESFNYSDWRVSWSYSDRTLYESSSGTPRKESQLIPLNKVASKIEASATGGYGWITTYPVGHESDLTGVSLRVDLTVRIYLVAADGTTAVQVAYATGSAGRGGSTNQYAYATTRTCEYTVTDQDKTNYKYAKIVYECSATSNVSITKAYDGTGDWHAEANPSGSATITVRDTINVFMDGAEMEELYFDSDMMDSLYYDGTIIF